MNIREALSTIPTTFADGDVQRERVGIVIIDLGGHPDAVVEALQVRAELVRAADPNAPSHRVRVFTIARGTEARQAVGRAVAAAGFAPYWRGFPLTAESGALHYQALVQLIIADSEEQAAPWLPRLEEGCGLHIVDPVAAS